MNLTIVNTQTQARDEYTEAELLDLARDLSQREGLNARQDVTVYIWHGKESPSPVLEVRDFHGKKARTVL